MIDEMGVDFISDVGVYDGMSCDPGDTYADFGGGYSDGQYIDCYDDYGSEIDDFA